MFAPTSRYADLPTAERSLDDGRRVRYVRRRFLPQERDLPAATEVTTTDADRLDLLANRALGDPEQYWRLCDANAVMNPATLLDGAGQRLRLPVTGAVL
jgi:hypothetical protein